MSAAATGVDRDATDLPAIEERKIAIEQQKLAVEQQKLAIEKSKVKWTAIASVVPLVAIVATVAFGFYTTLQQANLSFQLEFAKSIMQAPSASEAVSRAHFYDIMFPGRLPPNFINSDMPNRFVGTVSEARSVEDIHSKIAFITLLSGKGLDATAIVGLWQAMFDDEWARQRSVKDILATPVRLEPPQPKP